MNTMSEHWTRRRLGLAKERLVPVEAARDVAYSNDRPNAFHRISVSGAGQRSVSAGRSLELRHDALKIGVGSVAGSDNSPSVRQRVHVRRDHIPFIPHVDFQ